MIDLEDFTLNSSWEVECARWLDSEGQRWVCEPEFKLSNGSIYLPDFQLSGGDIIEIKGRMRPDAQIKWGLFMLSAPTLISA